MQKLDVPEHQKLIGWIRFHIETDKEKVFLKDGSFVSALNKNRGI